VRRDELQAKIDQRAALIEEMRSRNAAIVSEDRAPNAEENEAFDKLEADVRDLSNVIERENRVLALAAQSSYSEVEKAPGKAMTFEEWRNASGTIRPWDLAEVREATYNYWLKGDRGITNEEFRVLSKASGAAGLFLVPTDFYQQVIRALRFIGAIGAEATVVTTASGDAIQVPQNLAHGTASWIAESGSYTPSDETFAQRTLSAYKAGTKIIVSEELLQDSAFPLDSFLANEFGERIATLVEDAYINGDGSGKPQGIVGTNTPVTTYTYPTGQVAATTYSALVTAIYQVPVQYRDGMGIWISDGMFQRLVLLADSQNRPIWQVSTSAGAPDTLLGFPVHVNPSLAAPGANAKSMVVGNMKRGYLIRRVDGFSMQRQNELHSDSGQVGFRGYLRLDAYPILPDALRVVAFAAT